MVKQHELCFQMAQKNIADKVAPAFLAEVIFHNHHGQYNDQHGSRVCVVILVELPNILVELPNILVELS